LIPFGWLTYSPIQFEVLDAFGLKKENTFESVADKNNVLIASDLNNKAFQHYLKKRYPQIRVDTLTINQHHNFCLLKLRSK
jgi:beta-lactamase superfamily II metal-dependent hydrolase